MGNTYHSAPIVTRPLTRPYKDRPLLDPTSELKQRGETQQRVGRKKHRNRKANDGMVKV